MGTLLALAVAGIIGSLLSSTITKPINEIMHKAKKITDGDFGYNLVVQSHDELGKLTQTFNYMSDRLKSMLGEVTSEKKKLEAILNYMTDGIIAYNSSGEAILINPATKKLLGNKVSQVLYFDKFMIDLSIDLTMERIVNENAVCAPLQRIEYTDRFFKIQFALFTNEIN
jgi:two-component system sensor histidine kinase VicK